jgi:hypothetical protein
LDRRSEEGKIIKDLRSRGVRLLNDLRGYEYKTANEQAEREKVRRFCDALGVTGA